MSEQSDHKPLESIFKKPLVSAPKHLQCMLLHPQNYSLKVNYKKGKERLLADMLSHAYLTEVNVREYIWEFKEIDHRVGLPVTTERW